ncbi:hypothetical protein PanWU01x14_100340 [Parasponia andersonii]|uniref:Oxidative stress 3 n=1 Tax=Parasponia andersonii TaxID=3476 RepID=A0A2P5D3J7_PARAD|nr:hypothetical protein PanWU01x14_100340 [Parasponia andersonii]
MAQNAEKTSANPLEHTSFADDPNITDYHWNVKDRCTISEFKTMNCSSEESTSSIGSASSSDDASSACFSAETHLLHGFSEPMAPQLSMKKGLSKYYQGKARTFTSLSDVKCVQDLSKKEIPFVKRGHRTLFQSPKAIISKKNTRGSTSCLISKSFSNPRTV